mmetsp:Transcript_41964/g.69866  ORF Transcript_41964/g.69866 Transcript_41964/m.69866 type:complete len:427 (-) Transcript_41964:86-1366(-)
MTSGSQQLNSNLTDLQMSLDNLADADSFSRFLGGLESRELRINRILKDANTDEDADRELARIKDHLHKLKFNYVELETRQFFMDVVANDEELNPPTSQIEEVDTAMKTSKAKMQKLKEQKEQIEKDIMEVARSCCISYDSLQAEKIALSESVDILKERNALALQEPDLEYKSVLKEEVDRLRELEQQERELEGRTRQARVRMAEAQAQASVLREQSDEMESQGLGANGSKAFEQAKLQETNQWYCNMTHLVTALSGVAVGKVDRRSLELVLSQGAEPARTLTLKYKPGTTQLESAELIPNDTPIDDIIEAGQKFGMSLNFIITEVKARIPNYQRRKLEFQELMRRYPLTEVPGGVSVLISLPKRGQLPFLFEIDPDYPLPYSRPVLRSLPSSVPPQLVQAALDACSSNSLTDILKAIEGCLATNMQ